MEINLVQITRFKDKTKYARATFDPLIGTGVEDDTGGLKLISVQVGLVFLFYFTFENVLQYPYKTSSDLLQLTPETIILGYKTPIINEIIYSRTKY